MKGFFDKMKEGAADAAKMAQRTVESTRIKGQILSRENDIERIYTRMGDRVFQAYLKQDLSESEEFIQTSCREIMQLRKEISQMELKLRELKKEKECECGRVVPAEANYCPACGREFRDQTRPGEEEEAARPETVVCPSCLTENEEDAKFCFHCGADMDREQ